MRAENAIFHLSREHIYNEVARQEAIKALKKQIPKKPIINKENINCVIYTTYMCPCCKDPTIKNIIVFGGGYHIRKTPNYCWNCGQKLDWSELKE